MSQEILADDITCIVLGDGALDFILKMFKQNYDVYQVNDWAGHSQITKLISTENLWLHFNFYIIPDDCLELSVQAVKGEIYLGIVTYYVDDLASYGRAKKLYEKYFQDSIVPSADTPSNNKGQLPAPVFHEDTYLFSLFAEPDAQEVLGAGLFAGICSEARALSPRKDPLQRVQFITSSVEAPLLAEKTQVFLWMFENYKRKNRRLNITDSVLRELQSAVSLLFEEKCSLI